MAVEHPVPGSQNPEPKAEPSGLQHVTFDDPRFNPKDSALADYYKFTGKPAAANKRIRYADTVHQGEEVVLDGRDPAQRIASEIINLPLVQRMRNVSQLATARTVYKDAEETRFGHLVGSMHLAFEALDRLERHAPSPRIAAQIREYRAAVGIVAGLHDVGHLSPGSHLAHKVWFPGKPDTHEEITLRFFDADPTLRILLEDAERGLFQKTRSVLEESPAVPSWTWKLITGGGWNVDRGNWVYRDSVSCGVSHGIYDIGPVLSALSVTEEGELVVTRRGVPVIEDFVGSRLKMYRNVYFHPAALIADALHTAVGRRARELFTQGRLEFADDTMRSVLAAETTHDLSTRTLFKMVESWWLYHLAQWRESADSVLSDLADRVSNRRLLKRVSSEIGTEILSQAIAQAGYDPKYYLINVPPPKNVFKKDFAAAFKVLEPNGTLTELADASEQLTMLANHTPRHFGAFFAIPLVAFRYLRVQ